MTTLLRMPGGLLQNRRPPGLGGEGAPPTVVVRPPSGAEEARARTFHGLWGDHFRPDLILQQPAGVASSARFERMRDGTVIALANISSVEERGMRLAMALARRIGQGLSMPWRHGGRLGQRVMVSSLGPGSQQSTPCSVLHPARKAPLHGMVTGMATRKVTVTLDEAQLDQIRALVQARTAPSVSGFVQHAVAVALDDVAGWGAMLADALRQTGGPLSDDERAWADDVLGTGTRSAA